MTSPDDPPFPLHATPEVYETLLEASPDAVLVVDRAGEILFANVRTLQLFGYAKDELLGQTVERLVPSRSAGRHRERRAEYAASPTTRPMGSNRDLCGVRKDGTEFGADIALGHLTVGGVSLVMATVRDVTERTREKAELRRMGIALERELAERKTAEAALKRTESQLRQIQKMEAVGSLAGGIAHDFNNVLSVIMTYSDLLLDELRAGDTMRTDVEQIREAAVRATDLTRQLLAFSRRQILQPRVVDLNELVAGLERMLRRLLGEQIELSTLLVPRLDKVYLDHGQFEQVILNLTANARDAMPAGGKLTIETANIVIDDDYASNHVDVAPGHYVLLAVTDTGEGMDKATQERMFEPFFTTKERGKGTGLGLAMVFGIVKQSGGHLWAYSEPGRGTTIKLYLPRDERSHTSSPPVPAALATVGGDETILLVEDDDAVRAATKTTLRRRGYTVLVASNAGEAILVVERFGGRIDLLLTDVVMPLMSGRELAERLVATKPELRVLYMSGYTDNTIVHHGVLDAGIAFLQKPITPHALLRKVREVLDK